MRYTLILLALLAAGCNNLSPRDNLSPELKQHINNQNSKINGIEDNQNSIKFELGRLSNDLAMHDSQIKELQQGYLNFQAFRNENQGIQVLQGDGALVLVFASVTVAMLLYYFYRSQQYQRTAKVLARQIAQYDDPELHNQVLNAVATAEVEQTLYSLTKDLA